MNEQKTVVFFSSNTTVSVKTSMLEVTGGRIYDNKDHYLGLPVLVGRSKYNSLRWIKEKVWQHITNSKNKPLSQVG